MLYSSTRPARIHSRCAIYSSINWCHYWSPHFKWSFALATLHCITSRERWPEKWRRQGRPLLPLRLGNKQHISCIVCMMHACFNSEIDKLHICMPCLLLFLCNPAKRQAPQSANKIIPLQQLAFRQLQIFLYSSFRKVLLPLPGCMWRSYG